MSRTVTSSFTRLAAFSAFHVIYNQEATNLLEVKSLTTLTGKDPKLVIFDVEGVLIPKNRFFFEVGKTLGLSRLLKILFIGFLYQIGVIPLKTALKRIFSYTRGCTLKDLIQIAEKVPLMPDAKDLFSQLKEEGFKTGLISSGLPALVVKKLAAAVGADFGFGFEIGVNDDVSTGEIWGDVIEENGKFLVLSQILEAEKLSLSQCAVVADDRNNASIFLPEMQKVGFNPDFVLRIKADKVVNGKLSKILPAIKGESTRRPLPSKSDMLRETIHASGFFVPVVAGLIGNFAVALMISLVIIVYVISELARLGGKNLPIVSEITRYAASQAELYDFAAAPLYFAVGILMALLLFPAPINAVAIAIFTLGDSAASIFGGTLSKKPLPFNKGKTLEGSLAGFFFAFLAGSVFVSPVYALIGAVVAMTIEFLPLPVNDNILIPVGTGLALALIL